MKRKSEFVFAYAGNKILSVQRAFSTACDKAKIDGVRFHDLRHTAPSRMIEAGADLVTVSKILGHATIEMTMRYVHSTPEAMQMAVDKLGESFQKVRQFLPLEGKGRPAEKVVSC